MGLIKWHLFVRIVRICQKIRHCKANQMRIAQLRHCEAREHSENNEAIHFGELQIKGKYAQETHALNRIRLFSVQTFIKSLIFDFLFYAQTCK